MTSGGKSVPTPAGPSPAPGAGQAQSLFLGSGSDANPEGFSRSHVGEGGAQSAQGPEVHARASGGQQGARDPWGRVMLTAAQVYAYSDAWAAGRMMWEKLAEQGRAAGGEAVTLDGLAFGQEGEGEGGTSLPLLPPEAGCPPQLEAVLRGLLQARPQARLPPEEAIRALMAMLYGKHAGSVTSAAGGGDGDAADEEEEEEEDPAGGGSVDVVEAWVREQRLRLCEAEHRRAPLPRAALVGHRAAFEAEAGTGQERGGARGETGTGPASGAGADDPGPGESVGAGGQDGVGSAVSSTRADELMERAVLRAAEELGPEAAGGAGGVMSEVAAAVEGLSMGVVGGHAFEGELGEAVGAGVLQDRGEAERAVVQAGPMAVLRPPSAGTRAMFGWTAGSMPGRVRPLVEGEASLWDRHLRRELLSREDAAREVRLNAESLRRTVQCFGPGTVAAADGPGAGAGAAAGAAAGAGAGAGAGLSWCLPWDGPRDRSWVPASLSATGAGLQEPVPEGWTSFTDPEGGVVYKRADGHVQTVKPTEPFVASAAQGPLPDGWVQGGTADNRLFIRLCDGHRQSERP